MNQILAIAIGGATGALLRFFVSSGVYTWLGRGFPYGTLSVNVLGSFLIGLLTEALVLQRVAITVEYRSAILIGLLGSFTTFSTFSLETLYLIEQGNWLKAGLNVLGSVFACLFAVWVGLLSGRTLFYFSGGVLRWSGWVFPYGIVLANAAIAFLIGLIYVFIGDRVSMVLEHRAAVMVVVFGAFITFSSLYLILYLIEEGHTFKSEITTLLSVFVGNALLCFFSLAAGSFLGKHL
jgi:fluoride exporter